MGKDFISGVLAPWFLYSFPNSVVITTAPTDRQVEKVVWGEISNNINNSIVELPGTLKTKEIKTEEQKETGKEENRV